MKQYYESEVLFQLMERDGFNIPSSVPPYESEIKAYLINQVKQAYPKLTDYEAEWLLYNYTKHLPAEFPISSVSDVTKATFENVVPFAYQSAILKGKTLVNVNRSNFTAKSNITTDYVASISFFDVDMKVNTTYTIIAYSDNLYNYRLSEIRNGKEIGLGIQTVGTPFVYTTDTAFTGLRGYLKGDILNIPKGTEIKILIVEGDHSNEDIHYFEGMQSVKMPVLTTTGKNLFDENKKINGYIVPNSIKEKLESDIENTWTTYWIKAKPNTSYIIQGGNRNRWQIKSTSGVITHIESETITTLSDTEYIRCYYCSETYTASNVQIEEGTTSTSYEPYKTNILSTPSDLELRGIGNVRDTLDLVTGEVVEYIGEITLDGNQNFNAWESYGFYISDSALTSSSSSQCINNKYPSYTNASELSKATGNGIAVNNSRLYIKTNEVTTVNEFVAYLKSNPIVVQYLMANKSIKTVDLTTVNEKGETTYFMPLEGTMNVQSSGEIIQPTFDMSVPVEATTQNLASFIELEMEGIK